MTLAILHAGFPQVDDGPLRDHCRRHADALRRDHGIACLDARTARDGPPDTPFALVLGPTLDGDGISEALATLDAIAPRAAGVRAGALLPTPKDFAAGVLADAVAGGTPPPGWPGVPGYRDRLGPLAERLGAQNLRLAEATPAPDALGRYMQMLFGTAPDGMPALPAPTAPPALASAALLRLRTADPGLAGDTRLPAALAARAGEVSVPDAPDDGLIRDLDWLRAVTGGRLDLAADGAAPPSDAALLDLVMRATVTLLQDRNRGALEARFWKHLLGLRRKREGSAQSLHRVIGEIRDRELLARVAETLATEGLPALAAAARGRLDSLG